MVAPVSNFTLEGLDRFRVERRLGRGGFGEVFKVWDHKLEQHIAVKLLSQYDPHAHLQLAGEFSRVQSIKHPNLVELFELLYIRRRPVLLMEYLPDAVSFPSGVRDDIWDREADIAMSMTTIAATRRLLIEEEREQPVGEPLPLTHRQRFFNAGLGLLNGVDALHQRGLVHRDIKPSNVVLSEGRSVLLDYGLTMEDGGELLELAGTAGYIAPELLAGGRATRACDVYSVGMLFARSLLGRLPSARDRATGIDLYAHFLTEEDDADFFELLARSTARDPAARPAVSEIIEAMHGGDAGGHSSFNPEPYQVKSQSDVGERIAASLADNLCVLRGPIGSGRTAIVNEALARWGQVETEHEVFRVDAASQSFERLVSRIVHTGAERLMGFVDKDEVPVRGLRISNQLATRFPVIEAALEQLGMPRQLGGEPTGSAAGREPQLLAQWLRALYHDTPWILVIEHVDPTDANIVGFIGTLFQQGEFPQCGGALVTSTFRLDVLDDLPNALSFECQPLGTSDVEELLRSIGVPFDQRHLRKTAELMKAVSRGFRLPLNQLLAQSSVAIESDEMSGAEFVRSALVSIIKSLPPDCQAALWVISAAKSCVRPEWLRIVCGPGTDIQETLQHLGELYLVDRTLFADGSIGYVPYSNEIGRGFLEYVSTSTFPLDDTDARLEALSNASIGGTHLVARLYTTFGDLASSSEAYRRCIRLLLRSHRYDEALKICEEFMGHEELTITDFEAIASVFVHCRRPLEASVHMQRFASSSDSQLAKLSSRIRWEAGDRRAVDTSSHVHSPNVDGRFTDRSTGIYPSLGGLYQRLRSNFIRTTKDKAPALFEEFRDVHPAIEPTLLLFRNSRWHRCLEATTSDRWVEPQDPAELNPLLRIYDYVIARSQFLINRPMNEQIIANPAGSQVLLGNDRFQSAVSYLNVGWLLGLQEGSVLDVSQRIEECGAILDEYKSGPDLYRLLYEARSTKRILLGREATNDTIAWPAFASELLHWSLKNFFDAREAADERKARDILRDGFRQSYHGGSNLIALVLLMLFGQYTEERLFAEQSLHASGWQIPDVAACLILGLSRQDLYELRTEISTVEGIHLPSQATFDIRSFVGGMKPR